MGNTITNLLKKGLSPGNGKCYYNRELLLALCSVYGFMIINTILSTKNITK